MRVIRYVVIHTEWNNVKGVYPASTKEEARKIQVELENRQNWSFREPETAWIWNVETNEQDP